MRNQSGILMLVLLGLAVWGVWWCATKRPPNRDNFLSVGAMDYSDASGAGPKIQYGESAPYEAGSLHGEYGNEYSDPQNPYLSGASSGYHNASSAHFADMVDSSDRAVWAQQNRSVEPSPFERLEQLQGRSMASLTAAQLPQYNVDVANPATYAFSVQAPRAQLKNRQAMQADAIRGDIPIRFNPDVPLISKSSLGRDSQRLDGFFSDHFAHLYNDLTGSAYKNMPLQVVTQGTVMDY